MSVTILNEVKNAIDAHACSIYPNECCGFLYGTEHAERMITLSKSVDNCYEEEKRRRFQISSLDYMKAERFANQNNLTLLGIYHSHPDHPAMPSEFDTQHAFPFFSYVIVSVVNKEARAFSAWRLNDERKFIEETFQITQTEEVHYG